MSDEKQTTEPDWKRAADELHKALWFALHEADGEIVLTKAEQDAAGKPGFIDWFSGPDGLLVIRARESADEQA